jgi:solute carrier family 30 (zinc transporter), member 2
MNLSHYPTCPFGSLHRDDAESAARNQRKLIIVCILCLVFMVGEILGGFYSRSLALLGDAAHMFSDIAGFLISLVALRISARKPTYMHSFGFHRAEVIGALLSVALIWAVTLMLLVEAVERLFHPQPIHAVSMMAVAAAGLLVNIM